MSIMSDTTADTLIELKIPPHIRNEGLIEELLKHPLANILLTSAMQKLDAHRERMKRGKEKQKSRRELVASTLDRGQKVYPGGTAQKFLSTPKDWDYKVHRAIPRHLFANDGSYFLHQAYIRKIEAVLLIEAAEKELQEDAAVFLKAVAENDEALIHAMKVLK